MKCTSLPKLTLLALLLWAGTLAAGGIMLVRGKTAPGTDGRTAVLLASGERDFVLGEMRAMLETVQTITDALGRDDRAAIIAATRKAGRGAVHGVGPGLMTKLPMDFKQAGLAMHDGFDQLGQLAESGAPMSALTAQLGVQLGHCLACHQSWRLEREP